MSIYRSLVVISLAVVFCAACSSAPGGRQEPETEKAQLPAGSEPVEKRADTSATEAAEPRKNALKWTTASEVDNFGFDIYRSTSEDGPFDRVTEVPLPGAGTTDEPQAYEWYDFDIEAGLAYYYYIESISMGGVRERFSPIIKAPAKD